METIKYTFSARNTDRITLSIRGKKKMFKLIETMPFDPYRKMMSIVVKTNTGEYILYAKGADSSIMPRSRFKSNDEKNKI